MPNGFVVYEQQLPPFFDSLIRFLILENKFDQNTILEQAFQHHGGQYLELLMMRERILPEIIGVPPQNLGYTGLEPYFLGRVSSSDGEIELIREGVKFADSLFKNIPNLRTLFEPPKGSIKNSRFLFQTLSELDIHYRAMEACLQAQNHKNSTFAMPQKQIDYNSILCQKPKISIMSDGVHEQYLFPSPNTKEQIKLPPSPLVNLPQEYLNTYRGLHTIVTIVRHPIWREAGPLLYDTARAFY